MSQPTQSSIAALNLLVAVVYIICTHCPSDLRYLSRTFSPHPRLPLSPTPSGSQSPSGAPFARPRLPACCTTSSHPRSTRSATCAPKATAPGEKMQGGSRPPRPAAPWLGCTARPGGVLLLTACRGERTSGRWFTREGWRQSLRSRRPGAVRDGFAIGDVHRVQVLGKGRRYRGGTSPRQRQTPRDD